MLWLMRRYCSIFGHAYGRIFWDQDGRRTVCSRCGESIFQPIDESARELMEETERRTTRERSETMPEEPQAITILKWWKAVARYDICFAAPEPKLEHFVAEKFGLRLKDDGTWEDIPESKKPTLSCEICKGCALSYEEGACMMRQALEEASPIFTSEQMRWVRWPLYCADKRVVEDPDASVEVKGPCQPQS